MLLSLGQGLHLDEVRSCIPRSPGTRLQGLSSLFIFPTPHCQTHADISAYSSSVQFDGSDTTDSPNAKHLLAKTLDAYEQGPKTPIEM